MRDNRCNIFKKLRNPKLLIKKIESLGIKVKVDGSELVFIDIPESYWVNEEEYDPVFNFETCNDEYEFNDPHTVIDSYMFDHREVRDYNIFSELNDLLNYFNYKIVEIDFNSDSFHINIVDGSLYAEEEVFKAIKCKNTPDFDKCVTFLKTEILSEDMIKEKFCASLLKIINDETNIDMMVTLINRSGIHIETDIYSDSKKNIYKMKTKKQLC
jgi:hypothetical protein